MIPLQSHCAVIRIIHVTSANIFLAVVFVLLTGAGNGTATCTPDPNAFCNGKDEGLFCDHGWAKPTPAW